jgi:hypothetical protein
MIIRIIAAGRQVEIDDIRNFKAFSVRLEGPFDDPALQTELLGRVALGSDREHAWISEKALREWPSLAYRTRALAPGSGAFEIIAQSLACHNAILSPQAASAN